MNNTPDFNNVIDRKGTFCTQWDYVKDRFGQEDLLPFTVSDMDLNVPSEIVTALKDRLSHEVFGYTRWNHDYFKEAIVSWYQRRYDTKIADDWIVYSPAVIFSVAKLIEMWSNPGDGVLVQTPAYDAFFKVIESNDRQLVENPLHYVEGIYTIDFEDLAEKLAYDTTKILLLCSPHNPTGRIWTNKELEKIVELCEKHQVKIISDEIHMDVNAPEHQAYPLVRLNRYLDNIAICTSASKTFNTPGLIGSYCVIPSEKVRADFLIALKNKNGLSSTSILGMISTVVGYNDCAYWVDALNEQVAVNMQVIADFLAEHLPAVTFEKPEATYLAWLDVSALGYSGEQLQEALINIGKVAIMPGATYDPGNDHFIRFNVGCSQAKLIEGLNRMKIAVSALNNSK
ncbi:MalY/PatB family protein [Brochothrix thermosphacta]|uniref:MalY/PatB family protein n=1 Tax=Brochothrix thermosphacta TaxID=2756 RepID=UPI000EDB3727|nr:MalY/PatB family protein [Brochothrix thermosphacta]HCZ39804.1 beta-cystathionase [Brochothrix thermosphacta]HCZ46163.1 beta-cystathionase [Brochothrix thermosphacta]